MKIYTFLFIVFLFFPGMVFAEEITQFNVDIKINEDATIDIVEEIYYDFGSLNRHGIYRDIPVKYKDAQGNNRSIKIDNVRVVDQNNAKYTYQISKEGKNKRIKIGDVDESFTGKRVYIISYTIDGAMNYLDTHDELYWNAIGGEWTVPINAAHVVTHAPQIDEVECFSGSYGSTQKCESIVENSQKSDISSITSEFIQNNIMIGEYMTIVIGMPVGTIYEPTTQEKMMAFIKDNWILGLPFFVGLYMWRRWSLYGKDPEGRETIVPQYEAPKGLSPADVGLIMNESVRNSDISALFINLAVKGYMRIRPIEKKKVFSKSDYLFIQTGKDISTNTNPDEWLLYELVFRYAISSNHEVKMSQLKNSFYKDLESVKIRVMDDIISQKYFVKNPKNAKRTYILLSVIFFMCAFFAAGFFGTAGVFAFILSSIIILIFGLFMSKPTKKGIIMREYVTGLKMYMETAEKDRINFHNAPEKNPKTFEKLLPYAMVLGVEDKWAKQFEDIYEGQPDWYEGPDALSPVLFVNNMQGFSTAASTAVSSTPSSASSGGSGFSGGGGGGGFGGGGGGSW